MAIKIRTKIGAHEITALLGKGEVYRARHEAQTWCRHQEPDEFSRDPDHVSRFQREAEVLASLNHPNICVGRTGIWAGSVIPYALISS